MKKLLSIFVVFFVILSACEKVEYLEPDFDPGDGLVTIKVTGTDGETAETHTTTAGETIFMVESNKQFIFSYETELDVEYVMWTFWDESESFDDNPIYFYGGYVVRSITLMVVDTDGDSYQTTSYLNLFPRYPGTPFYITDVEESGDKYTITAGIYKNAWYGVSGNYHFFGSITDIPWSDHQLINPADTNYRMSQDGNLHPATGVGHWVKTQLDLYPGDHAFGVVRFDGEDGIWGNFKNSLFVLEDEPTLISFHLTEDGEIIPIVPLPGNNGDQGPSSVLRFTINSDNSVTVYVNLDGVFSQGGPWWSYLDHNENWHSPISLSQVEDFPTWGAFTIGSTDHFPVRMVWGLYEDQQNDNMSQSIFWDSYYQYCYLHLLM